MTKMRTLKLLFGLGLMTFLFLSNFDNPPDGHTGAPGEDLCTACHSGGSYNGNVTVSGLPSTVQANTIYNVDITITATSGSPVAGGFQLVALDGSNNNAGNLIVVNAGETGTDMSGGRTYMEHRSPKNFSGNTVTWSFDWQAPNGPNNENITFYFVGNMVNLNNQSTGDTPVNSNFSVTVTGAADPIVVSIDEVNHVSCNGGSDGSITASATGGTPPLFFNWSNGMFGETISGLPAGNYTVTVTDGSGGGPSTASATVNQPPPLNIFEDGGVDPYTCTTPARVTVSASGGTPGYEFNWSTGASGPTIYLWPEDLPASVTVTDNNNCTSELIISNLPGNTEAPTAIAMGVILTCADPIITLSGAGSDEGPCFSYSWSGPSGFQSTELHPSVSIPGLYTLVVTNVCNGCTASTEALVMEDTEAPNILIDFPVDTFACGVDVVEIDACFSGDFQYAWSTLNGLIVSGNNNCTVEVGLPASYLLTITNPDNGCTSIMEVVVGGVTKPVIQIDSIADVRCFGSMDGYVALSGSGGVGPYDFLWRDSSDLAIRDDLAAGTYLVTMTDAEGCVVVDSFVIGHPPQIQLNLVVTHETEPGANDGTAGVDPDLGHPPYLVVWSTGDSTFTIDGLAPGSYSVSVTDSLGCEVARNFQIAPFGCEIEIEESIIEGILLCHGDESGVSIELLISNPNGPFTVLWSTGDTTLHLGNLGAGRYSVIVTDSVGCEARDTFLITQPDLLEIALDSIVLASAPDVEDGAIYVQVIGGTPGYNYFWENEQGETISNEKDLIDVLPGIYTLFVTDDHACLTFRVFMIGNSSLQPAWTRDVRLYPNPVSSWLTVELPAYGNYSVQLQSMHGVVNRQLEQQQGVLHVDMDTLPAGVYLLRLRDASGHGAIFRVVK